MALEVEMYTDGHSSKDAVMEFLAAVAGHGL